MIQANIIKTETDLELLKPSRAYTISLKPQIIYAKSRFLPTLVSSQIHSQLEFQAVGSFFILVDGKLQKIPSNREDVFADDTLSIRDKRKLMSLLRYVVDEHEEDETQQDISLKDRLDTQFKVSDNLGRPIQALTLSTDTLEKTKSIPALSRLKRHLMSTGYFGPGLAAVMAKYGGNSEMAQVACRAGAVGGSVYLLGHGVKSVEDATDEGLVHVSLSDDTRIKTKHIVGMASDLPATLQHARKADSNSVTCSINIISSPLRHLFTAASENAPIPAVVIVMACSDDSQPPVYLQVHSEDTGECPSNQCKSFPTPFNLSYDEQTI